MSPERLEGTVLGKKQRVRPRESTLICGDACQQIVVVLSLSHTGRFELLTIDYVCSRR